MHTDPHHHHHPAGLDAFPVDLAEHLAKTHGIACGEAVRRDSAWLAYVHRGQHRTKLDPDQLDRGLAAILRDYAQHVRVGVARETGTWAGGPGNGTNAAETIERIHRLHAGRRRAEEKAAELDRRRGVDGYWSAGYVDGSAGPDSYAVRLEPGHMRPRNGDPVYIGRPTEAVESTDTADDDAKIEGTLLEAEPDPNLARIADALETIAGAVAQPSGGGRRFLRVSLPGAPST